MGSLFDEMMKGPADKGMGAWFNEWMANPQHFNCRCDPEKHFTAKDWEFGQEKVFGNDSFAKEHSPITTSNWCGLIDDEGYKIRPGAQINTSVFEEAEVVI